ncbi:MAG: hypothetical protein GY899_02105 [Verrucomicrobiaceae bacterium]|nr:hypothetical protein [Verrucomicrobiaceae bacterium]
MHSIKTAAISAGSHYFAKRPLIRALLSFLSVTVALTLLCAGEEPNAPVPRPSASKEGALAELVNAQTRKLLPEKPGRNHIFDAYVSKTSPDVAWSRSWIKVIDFSGVAWDNPRTLTLVSPRHALMARHYQRKAGSKVTFHDRRGRPVTRKISGIENLIHDIAVVILDEDVPVTVKAYRLLPPGESYSKLLRGSHTLITAWAKGERKVRIHAISSINAGLVTFFFYSQLADAATLPAKFFAPLIAGDSGNPSFLWLNNEPVLIETHTYGGSGRGPFFSTPENFSKINAAMLKLSKAHKAPVHQLQTVSIK